MRRFSLVATVTAGLFVAVLVLPRHVARTQAPGDAPEPRRQLDARDFPLGELLEGDAPLDQVDLSTLPEGVDRSLVTTQGIPAPEGMAVDFRHYPTPEEINTFLGELEATYPDLVESIVIGTSWQGRPIRALRVTHETTPEEVAGRPVVYIDAQNHARELISNQVALYTAWWLVHFYGRDPYATHLVDTRVLYVVPSVNPDGNAIALADYQSIRKTANPRSSDDDGDRRFDEDPSVGYGYGTDDVTRYAFDVEWADRYPENPFQQGHRGHLIGEPEYMGRFTGALGGERRPVPRLDMDGDGSQDEDEVGGVDSNRNYASHWADGSNNDPRSETYRGPTVWSEPEARAVRDLLDTLPHLATGLSYHSGVDLILHPWGWSPTADLPDADLFELLSRKGSQLTEVNGFAGSPHTWTARGLYSATGSTLDYLYETRGAYAWSPEVYGGSSRYRIERVGATGAFSVGESLGMLFNPIPEQILASTDRWHRFALYVLAATPNVELNDLAVEGDRLVVTVGNEGILPAEVTVLLNRTNIVLGPTLRAESARVTFDRSLLTPTGNRLSVQVRMPIGTAPHEVERAEWTFDVGADGAPTLTRGTLTPFVDLGARFADGWWAPDAWDVPGRYHLPGDQPIAVTPPATATPGPTQTPPPTFVPTLAPTATPTPPPPTTPQPLLYRGEVSAIVARGRFTLEDPEAGPLLVAYEPGRTPITGVASTLRVGQSVGVAGWLDPDTRLLRAAAIEVYRDPAAGASPTPRPGGVLFLPAAVRTAGLAAP